MDAEWLTEDLMARMRGMARKLDWEHREDLFQEMALAVLEAGPGNTDSYYLRSARTYALRWMKREEAAPISFTDAGIDPASLVYPEPEPLPEFYDDEAMSAPGR